MKLLAATYEDAQLDHERKTKAVFVCLRIKQIWKRRTKKWGGGGDNEKLYKKRLLRSLSFMSTTMADNHEEKAYNILKPFLEEHILRGRLK